MKLFVLSNDLSSRPEQDGFIVLRSGETCRLIEPAIRYGELHAALQERSSVVPRFALHSSLRRRAIDLKP